MIVRRTRTCGSVLHCVSLAVVIWLSSLQAPWCGHCRTLVPEMKRAATTLKAKNIKTLAVNSDGSPGLAQQLGIRGFPAIKWMYNGQLSDYSGVRHFLERPRIAPELTACVLLMWQPRTYIEITQFAQTQAVVSAIVDGKVLNAGLGYGSRVLPI